MTDVHLERARAQVDAVLAGDGRAPRVQGFFDEATFTVSYVVSDPATRRAAIIDSVWDFDEASGRTGFQSADEIIAYVREQGLTVEWVLETHAHADHLSSAPYIKAQLGGKIVMGKYIDKVQKTFKTIFNFKYFF